MELRDHLQGMNDLDTLTAPRDGVDRLDQAAATPPKPSVQRMLVTAGAAISVIALAVFASIAVERQAKASAEKGPAIVVLPFENVGRKEGQDFAEGMSEEITNRLASLRGLRVVGRHSVRGYTGTSREPQEIANELGARYALTGTVRWDQSSDGKVMIRVSPVLLRADDATQVWGEAYQTVLAGVFEVNAKVSSAVASALDVTLLRAEKAALAARPTKNLQAYGFYLRGRALLDTTTSSSQAKEAIANLEKAAALDSQFLLAWAYLAVAQTKYFSLGGDPTPNRLSKAGASLDRAVRLDPANPDVHIARGIFLYHGQRYYDQALQEFAIAEDSRPNDYGIHLYKGLILRRQGKWTAALVSLQRALDLEPRSAAFALEVSRTLGLLRRFDEAEKYADQAMLLDPGDPDVIRLKSRMSVDFRGNVPQAIEHLRNAALAVKPQSRLVGLLQAMTWPAVEDPALRQLLLDARPSREIPQGGFYFNKLRLYLYLNDVARARAYADTAVAALQRETKSNPDAIAAYMRLSFAHAVLGNRAEAMRAMNESEQLLSGRRDLELGAERLNGAPAIYLLLGDRKSATAAIEKRLGVPGGMTRNRVRLDPLYAELRGDPRFEKLIEAR